MAATFKINTREFDRTIRQYAAQSRKDFDVIVNTKAYFIARAACRETFRPEKSTIKNSLSALIHTTRTTAKGNKRKSLAKNSEGVPIAALLINWRRGKTGKPGLFGAAMKEAVKGFIKRRQDARAFMASGWIPAIKAFASVAENKSKAAPSDREASAIKKPLGSYSLATGGRSIAKIINSSFSKLSTTPDPMGAIAQPALQRAIDMETASMKQYMEQKMKESARAKGIRTA